jgi:hypothetical protein
MRTLRLLVIAAGAAVLAPATGCKWLDEMRANSNQSKNRGTGKIEPVDPAVLVAYLNDRAARLQSVEYDTHLHVSGKDIPAIGASLDGSLAAAQPRNFRMASTNKLGTKIDMGSNDQQFWVYIDGAGDPFHVYASHADFESGRAKMPGGLPFEPDWVMQALGMAAFPATTGYDIAVNDRDRTYVLGWLGRVPGGGEVRKEIVFDYDGGGTHPVVTRHLIREARGNKLIASADVKTAQSVVIGTDKTGRPVPVQYPTHVVLKWVNPRFEMDLTLDKAVVNQVGDDRRGLFARPERNVRALDLAQYREFPPAK